MLGCRSVCFHRSAVWCVHSRQADINKRRAQLRNLQSVSATKSYCWLIHHLSFSVSCPGFISWLELCVTSWHIHFAWFCFFLERTWNLCVSVHMINAGPTLEVTPPCSPIQSLPTAALLRPKATGDMELRASGFMLPEAFPSTPCQKTPLFAGSERGWAVRGPLKRATKLGRQGRGCRGGGHWERCLKPHGGEEARHRASLYDRQ